MYTKSVLLPFTDFCLLLPYFTDESGRYPLFDAIEVKMPDDYITKLRTQVSPTAMDKARKWFSGIRAKFDKFVYKE